VKQCLRKEGIKWKGGKKGEMKGRDIPGEGVVCVGDRKREKINYY
jgi:hypothetical protein